MPAKLLILFFLIISLGCGGGGGGGGGGSDANGIPTADFDITGSWLVTATTTGISGNCGPNWEWLPVGTETTTIWDFAESGDSVTGLSQNGFFVTGVITDDQYLISAIDDLFPGSLVVDWTLTPLDCGSMTGSATETYVESPFSCSATGSIIMTRIGPCPPGSVNPFADVDNDGISNDCDVDHTGGQDCDFDGQDDNCQVDSDGNGIIDPCES